MGKDNDVLLSLLESLGKSKKPVWKKVAYELSRSRRQRIEVNLSKLASYSNDDSILLVPGKVLGSGAIASKVTVVAFSFSKSARQLISQAGGKAVSIESMYKSNPDGKGIVLLK